jgi:hypothetical protein
MLAICFSRLSLRKWLILSKRFGFSAENIFKAITSG